MKTSVRERGRFARSAEMAWGALPLPIALVAGVVLSVVNMAGC